MNPIPTLVRRLWDTWDLRVLVLLSFTLQVILSLFGSRRKYISTMWINSILVRSAYLMADWVATVALGKISDSQNHPEKSNILWALWAPLLLLHLGGPDGITAYSLEDNKLQMWHLLGLVVQLFVAIYVILLSWKNSWFSFMSLPALVAGVIKYVERTWVLKWVSDDKYLHRSVFGSLLEKYPTEGHDYVRVLVVANENLNWLKEDYLARDGSGTWVDPPIDVLPEANILRDATEVGMGLMYDLLYTKSPLIYSKRGLIMRCISFGCTVSVLLGLTFQIVHLRSREEENWQEIDIAITGVLTVGAVALEIYAAIAIFSSNWMMLWLIKNGKTEWVTWLSKKFPWLFNKKKNWSRVMGQFDLLGYLLKERHGETTSVLSKIIKFLLGPYYEKWNKVESWVLGKDYEAKWNKYRHTREWPVDLPVYDAILRLCYRPEESFPTPEMIKIWRKLGEPCRSSSFLWPVKRLHLATKQCFNSEMEVGPSATQECDDTEVGQSATQERYNSKEGAPQWKKDSEALSNYMMYLLVMHPSLLPNIEPPDIVEEELFQRNKPKARHEESSSRSEQESLISNDRKVQEIVGILRKMNEPKKWETIRMTWLRMLLITASSASTGGRKYSHLQQLTQGGELLTFIWFAKPNAVLI